ncbi:MAG TPA: type II toxin-antitoxin system RelE/ParE family toxin [Methanosarcina sp.]|nr:type II toxin-antitoxin system RelE/ParE family toxin [Methanosarcina sp.]
MFEVLFDIPSQDFLQNADESTHSRVREILEELALDPVPQGAKRIIESQEKIFRLRARHLRLLYRVNYENRTLVVITIEPLSRMYR